MLSLDSMSSLSSSSSFYTPLIITIFIIILTLSLLFKTKTRSQTLTPPTPCPQSLPILGNLLSFLQNHHRFHEWVTDMLSETPFSTLRVRTFLNLSKGVCTANPDNIRHMLSSNFSNYVKGSRFHTVLNELLGDGIFAVDGHLWSYQRKVASYEFSTNSLKSFISDTVNLQIVNRLIPYLSKACDEERVIDLHDVLQKFAFDNVCRVAFGVDPSSLEANSETFSGNKSEMRSEPNFFSAFDDAVEICSSRFMSPFPFLWKLMRFLNIGSEKRFMHDIEVINNFAMRIIQSKEEAIAKSSSDQDLLTRFMSSISDSKFRNREEKRKFLRDVVISFILAGKDTTSTALTWFFWLLAGNPSSERKILTELSNFNDNDNSGDTSRVRVFGYDELKKLNYLHAAVSETLRLFPPVPINTRLTVDDDVWPDGTHVARGWFADYSAYAMGRNDRVWGEHCREFRAERWLDDEGKYQPLDQFKFPVFHCGPRMCLGKDMAYVQMKSIIAAVLGEFEVLPVDGGVCEETMVNPPFVLSLLLKMRGGLPVRLRRR